MKNLSAILVIFAIVLTSSCKKEDEKPVVTPQPETKTSIEDFFKKRITKGETFTFNAEDGASFETKEGAKIIIPKNAFVKKDKSAVTGAVEGYIKELYSNSEMILNQKFPLSNGTIMDSDGQFFINFTQDGEDLSVKKGTRLQMNLTPPSIDPQMKLFFAGRNENNNELNWLPPTDPIANNISTDSILTTYYIPFDSLGWINVDKLSELVEFYEGYFNLKGPKLNDIEMQIYYTSKEFNSAWPTYYEKIEIVGTKVHQKKVIGSNTNVLFIIMDGDFLYYGARQINPSADDFEYEIILTPCTEQELEDYIKSLDNQ